MLAGLAAALGALACGGEDAQPEHAFEGVTLVQHPGGYGGAPAGPASTCEPSYRNTMAVDGASRELTFDVCMFEAPNVYTVVEGHRALTEAELSSIEQTLARLDEGAPEWQCGADAGFVTLDITRQAGTKLYISASHCPEEFSAGRAHATGISDLWSQLDTLRGD